MDGLHRFFAGVVQYVLRLRAFTGSYLEPALPFLRVAALVLSGLFIWLILFCNARSGWLNKRIENWMDYLGVGDVGRRRQLKVWKQIVNRMKTKKQEDWKMAILEADKVMDEVLKSGGYRSDTTDGRFKQLTAESYAGADALQNVHRFRNRVAQEPDLVLEYAPALDVLKIYKKAFQEFGLLD